MRLYVRANEAANSFHAQAAEVHQMGKELEELTKDSTLCFVGLRVQVEARAV